MKRVLAGLAVAVAIACGSSPTTPNDVTSNVNPVSGPDPSKPYLFGAGDIGDCANPGVSQTGKLIQTLLTNNPGATVFANGDLAYPMGAAENFTLCFQP